MYSQVWHHDSGFFLIYFLNSCYTWIIDISTGNCDFKESSYFSCRRNTLILSFLVFKYHWTYLGVKSHVDGRRLWVQSTIRPTVKACSNKHLFTSITILQKSPRSDRARTWAVCFKFVDPISFLLYFCMMCTQLEIVPVNFSPLKVSVNAFMLKLFWKSIWQEKVTKYKYVLLKHCQRLRETKMHILYVVSLYF